MAAHAGIVRLPRAPLSYFVEGADLDVLKANLVPSIGASSMEGEGVAVGSEPTVNLLRGRPGSVSVRLKNFYTSRLDGTMHLDLPAAWAAAPDVPFPVEPGDSKNLDVPVTVPATDSLESRITTADGDV